MNFDQIIKRLGNFGVYEKRQYLLLCLPAVASSVQVMMTIFTLTIPKHRCALPDWNDTYSTQSEEHMVSANQSIPYTMEGGEMVYSQCEIYEWVNGTRCKYQCSSWVYDQSMIIRSFVSQHDLVCSKKQMRYLAQVLFMVGSAVGSFFMTWPSDLIGRKKMLMLSMIILIVSGISISLATDITFLSTVYFFTGASVSGTFDNAFVMGMELASPTKRKWTGIIIEFFWAGGGIILAGVAYVLRDWQHVQLAVSIPSVGLLLYFWLVPESARWLKSKGKTFEAQMILTRAAKLNKVKLTKDFFEGSIDDGNQTHTKENIWQILKKPLLLFRCLVVFFNWYVCSLGYYGILYNVGILNGDIYLNLFCVSVAEMGGFLLSLIFIDVLGRKPVYCACMLMGGAVCVGSIIPAVYGSAHSHLSLLVLSLIGRLMVSCAFATIWVYASELFPTVVRTTCMGICAVCARLGGISAPFIVSLTGYASGNTANILPLIVFGLAMVVAGVISLVLPETRNKFMPDTLLESEQIGRLDRHEYIEVHVADTTTPKPVCTTCLREEVEVISPHIPGMTQ